MTKPFEITEEEYENYCDEDVGFCLYCREITYGVEPDARNYLCDNCGVEKVFGIQELIQMDLIQFKE